jgi:uncharacterized membrane protein YhaH (DUF805 family)
MAYLMYLLFGFEGRSCRKAWWLGTLLVAVASVGGTLLLDPSVFDLNRASPRTPSWPDTIWQLALVIPGTALMVKRFNDRNWPYWLGFLFGALGAGLTLERHFDVFLPGFASRPENVVIVGVGLLFLFAFIDNGFLRGSFGPNRYGPDPLVKRELFLGGQ